VHVTEFLDPFTFGPDIEIVEAVLPDVCRETSGPQGGLTTPERGQDGVGKLGLTERSPLFACAQLAGNRRSKLRPRKVRDFKNNPAPSPLLNHNFLK